MLHHRPARAWLIAPLAAAAILAWDPTPARTARGRGPAKPRDQRERDHGGSHRSQAQGRRSDCQAAAAQHRRKRCRCQHDRRTGQLRQLLPDAGDKKYFVLRDAEGKAIATNDQDGYITAKVKKDGTYTWWAKFPAPPAEVTSVTFYTPIAPPFEDLPSATRGPPCRCDGSCRGWRWR